MSLTFEQLSEIVQSTAIQNAENSSSIGRLEKLVEGFVTESRLSWGKNERLLAEVHLALKTTQNENQALATNIGRMVEAMNNRGNL
jgi:ribosomal protein S1